MNKYILISTLLFSSGFVNAVNVDYWQRMGVLPIESLPVYNTDYSVVSNASYCLLKRQSKEKTLSVDFYTFDGEKIITKESYPSAEFGGGWGARCPEAMLDQGAPKPRPVSCKVWYWPAYRVLFSTKGCPGWFISFFDKNGFVIDQFRFDKDTSIITVGFDQEECFVDVSRPQTIDKKFSLDLSLLENIEIEDQEKGTDGDLLLDYSCYYIKKR